MFAWSVNRRLWEWMENEFAMQHKIWRRDDNSKWCNFHCFGFYVHFTFEIFIKLFIWWCMLKYSIFKKSHKFWWIRASVMRCFRLQHVLCNTFSTISICVSLYLTIHKSYAGYFKLKQCVQCVHMDLKEKWVI